MTVRPGQYGSLIAPASQTLGGVAGRTFALNNSEWAVLNVISFTLTPTGTVGNRAMVARALDASGNNICQSFGSGIAAGTAQRVVFGAGMAGAAGNAIVLATWPVELPIPSNASIQIFDAGNIDPNDALSLVVAIFAM